MKLAKPSTYMSISFDKIAFVSPNHTKNSNISFPTTGEVSLTKEMREISGAWIVDNLHKHWTF